MVFLGIYRAIYDYAPQSDNEIAMREGDLLMVLEKSTEDAWWTAKKKGAADDDDEPEGLIPNNYVEEATPECKAKALYDYTRQTDEELSFKEDALLDVYDTTDPDWTLVGVGGDYGFAPSNYIDFQEGAAAAAAAASAPAAPQVTSPSLPPRTSFASPPPPAPDSDDEQQPPTPDSPVHQSPAAALAGIIQKKSEQTAPRSTISPPPNVSAPTQKRVQFTPEESDEEAPPPRLPQRPPSQSFSPPPPAQYSPRSPSPPPPARSQSQRARAVTFDEYDPPDRRDQPPTPLSGSGYHLYNVYEYLTQPGKNKKMPITLGINIPKGMIMIAPEKSRDGPQQEWSADKLDYHSQEGKHIFLELKRPSKSIDIHCGAKDTASEIISALGELSGAAKGAGLREVLAAGSGHSNVQRKGVMLFDFMAQGDDEVTVGMGDEVLILDDFASDEWWKVRRLKNNKEGVVPSNYVEITETVSISAPAAAIARSGTNAGRSTVEQNRLEEQELTRQATKAKKRPESEVRTDQRSKRDSSAKDSKSSSKPNPAKVRQWTDRTGSFRVDAEFLTVKDGKIHLHKLNGVKIAVPVPKMSVGDLEYVERATGMSLDDDKPLAEIKRRNTQRKPDGPSSRSASGITVEKKPSYDWFDFFLSCGVNPQICERYAQAFDRDQMGEENLPDISEKLLRTLGLKEGDILRVMKHLDSKFGHNKDQEKRGEGEEGGLFSGPGGTLRNNTRKGRPAPPVQTNDVVDPKAFEQKSDDAVKKPADSTATPLASAPTPEKKVEGFEDNAWEVKPSRQASTSAPAPAAEPAKAPEPATTAPAPAAAAPALTGSMGELSLLDMPALKPEVTAPAPAPQPPAQAPAPAQAAQPTGATPSLFDQVAQVKAMPADQINPPRLRPQPPQQNGQGGLIAPPPQRAASAPQNPQNASAFPPPPLQPQLTGYNGAPNMHAQVAPPGQSLSDLQRMQQQQQQMQGFQQNPGFPQQFPQNGIMPQPTGYNTFSPGPMQPQPTGYQFQPPIQSQPTGFQPGMQPMQTGFQPQGFQQGGFQTNASPFADPPRAPFQPQPTGFGYQAAPLNPQATGVNRFLPPAIQPAGGFGNTPSPPPVPPMPTQAAAPALVPQRTGPAPNIKFGVQAKKLTPQPTGRANLAKATPQNPFGF